MTDNRYKKMIYQRRMIMSTTYNPFQKIAAEEKKSHADQLAEDLKKMIIRGQLTPESALPNENELCKQLNVSRSTLREAYKILEIQGYISRTKHGTFVKEKDSVAIDGNFSASLELSKYNELIEFVSLLESEAVYLAAGRATEEQMKDIEKYMYLCEENKKIPGAIEEFNYKFHLSIRIASNNQLLISALSAAYETFNQKIIKVLLTENDFIDNCMEQHQLLFEAIKTKNAEKAKQIAYDHLMSDIEQYKKNS